MLKAIVYVLNVLICLFVQVRKECREVQNKQAQNLMNALQELDEAIGKYSIILLFENT